MAVVSSVKQKEDFIQKFWEKNSIYEKVKRKSSKGRKFYFHDGPPYATGYIHMGTAMNKIFKDFFLRFFRMNGFNVWDQPGYDTHGVPIENKIEKKLGFKSKVNIEKFGVENFIEECKKYATQFISVMNDQFNNLGVWMDWDNPYITLTNDYIEGAWYTFKKAFEKGFLYKGNYPVHVCPHCETAVAYNEIEYENVSDISIYVKFRIGGNEYILIWTTTPWTLPANTGVMAKPDAEYVKVKVDSEILILAKKLLENVMKKVGKSYEIIETLKGRELEELKYQHPLADLFPFQSGLKDAHRIVLSDQFVTLDEGTGLVHTAPGHGQEDYKVGIENKLPAPSPIKMDGRFDEKCGRFSGKYVKDADSEIIQELKNRGLLFYEEKIEHEYPFCWRCDTPLLLISIPQWFFKVTAFRDKLLEENEKIKWVPDWARQRFKNWLESLGDWPISRQRYWGIPLPIWVCEKCDSIKVIGSRKELSKVPKDFHKPYIDKIILKCKCGGRMKRVPDVLDVWFDSGVSSWASLGYPNEKRLFKKLWPADFITEGSDQIRGWWNSQLITSVITFNRTPFLNVLFQGMVLDVHGVKMSKSKGNVVTPEQVIDKYGRDVLRFFYLSNPGWDDYYFSWDEIDKIARSFVVIRNVMNFVKTYVQKIGKTKKLKKEDRWILSRLNQLIETSTKHCRDFIVHKVAKDIEDFILNDFSRWYVKLIRDRVWISYKGSDKASAFFTLYSVAESLSRLLAPFCPFIAEEIHQEIIKPLKKGCESVHLCEWPKANKKLIDKNLNDQMDLVRVIVEYSYTARQKSNMKLRWPIRSVIIVSEDKKVKQSVNSLKDVLLFMCNCKDIRVVRSKPKGNYFEMKTDFGLLLLDKKMGKDLEQEALFRELIREIQDLRKKNGFSVKENISLTLNSDEDTNEYLEKISDRLKKEVGAKKLVIGRTKGKYKGMLKFHSKNIEINFDRG